jgi:hypothetical protein
MAEYGTKEKSPYVQSVARRPSGIRRILAYSFATGSSALSPMFVHAAIQSNTSRMINMVGVKCDYCPGEAVCVLPFPDANSPALCAHHKAKLYANYETRELGQPVWGECTTGQFPEHNVLFKEDKHA